MPFEYVIDVERELVYSRGWGDVTEADLVDHQRRLVEDPQFRPTFSQLVDFRSSTSINVTTDAVRNGAQRHVFGPHARRAIVVLDNERFGLAEVFQSYRQLAGGEELIPRLPQHECCPSMAAEYPVSRTT
jgi:hypothetical protein